MRPDNKTAGRTLEIFEAFHKRRAPVSLTELAHLLKAPVSSCHGIVRTLIARGYLYSIDADRTLYPTKRLLRIAESIESNDPILGRLVSSLSRLRDVSGETLVLGKWQDKVVVYLDVVESRQAIRYSAQPGDTRPVHFSSIGKALLANMDDEAVAKWFSANPVERLNQRTTTSTRQIAREIEMARKLGYCVAAGETTADVMALATAVPSDRDPIGIAIAGPIDRMKQSVKRHAALLLALRKEIDPLS
jgi:IclR family transcriptional regulator, acetate operon repressor